MIPSQLSVNATDDSQEGGSVFDAENTLCRMSASDIGKGDGHVDSATGITNQQRSVCESDTASRGVDDERVSRLSLYRKRRRAGAGPSNTGESAAKKVAK